MADEMKAWAGLLGTFGLAVVLVLWHLLIDRPRQQLREDQRDEANRKAMADALKIREESFRETRAEDRQHAMELAKIQAEVHRAVAGELKLVGDATTGELKELGEKLTRFINLEEQRRPHHR